MFGKGIHSEILYLKEFECQKKITAILLIGIICSCAGNNNNGRLLILAMEDDIITFDPYLHDDSITYSVLSNIFEGLVSFDSEMRLEPALAISWENPDDLTWRFILRPGVYFHNGHEFTSADVKYSLERARQGKVCHYLSTVQSVNVIDKLIVTIQGCERTKRFFNHR